MDGMHGVCNGHCSGDELKNNVSTVVIDGDVEGRENYMMSNAKINLRINLPNDVQFREGSGIESFSLILANFG